ncbi:MAG: cob(I)yrinic acid a,c-diamide adenosyltransferase [Bacteriovoracaceae bacterium]
MKKARIYTKTGDKGDTGLVSGTRISKGDARIDLYGELDDFNSRLGLAASLIESESALASAASFLHHVQSAVFDLGSNLACEAGKRSEYKLPEISDAFIDQLEKEIDRMEHELPALTHFILPGGTVASAAVHLARTGARNVERKLVKYAAESGEKLPLNALIFLNRLSDYLFVLSRHVNKVQNGPERTWIPRK